MEIYRDPIADKALYVPLIWVATYNPLIAKGKNQKNRPLGTPGSDTDCSRRVWVVSRGA